VAQAYLKGYLNPRLIDIEQQQEDRRKHHV
jgi:hypothetical protein